VEEITTKKPKTVFDLLIVTDVSIEARAWLLEPHNKGLPRKKQQDNREVNTVDRGDCGNRENSGNHQQQPTEQKEKRPFHHPDDVEKWCEIHRTARHDL
jgi:hypothetical protein